MFRDISAYQILEVPEDATAKQIRSSYRRLVFKWHPDKWRNCGVLKQEEARVRTVMLISAYECIGDEERRRQYDQFGKTSLQSFLESEAIVKRSENNTVNSNTTAPLFPGAKLRIMLCLLVNVAKVFVLHAS